MNITQKKLYLIALLVSLSFTVLCTGFYIYEVLFHYDPFLGLFDAGMLSEIFLPLLYILAVVVFVVFAFLFRGSLQERAHKTSLPNMFAAGFAAFSTAVFVISFAIDFFAEPHDTMQSVFGFLLMGFGVIAALYFAHSVSPRASGTRATLLCMGTVLFCLCYAFFAYFDTAFSLGSPLKIMDQLTFLVLVLFFLAEVRFRFGAICEAFFFPICMTATLLCGAGSITGIVYMAVEGRPLVVLMMRDFLLFGIFLYALTKQISFLVPAFAPVAGDGESSAFTAEETDAAPTPSVSPFAQETFDLDTDAQDEDLSLVSDEEPADEDGENIGEADLDLSTSDNQ